MQPKVLWVGQSYTGLYSCCSNRARIHVAQTPVLPRLAAMEQGLVLCVLGRVCLTNVMILRNVCLPLVSRCGLWGTPCG